VVVVVVVVVDLLVVADNIYTRDITKTKSGATWAVNVSLSYVSHCM